MCKTKTLCVRVEKSLYDKITKSSVGISEFVRESVIQSLEGNTTRQGKKHRNTSNNDVIQTMQEQITQMKAMQEHMTGEIIYLRELHQNTMGRVLQIPENTAYDRDPIADLQQTNAEPIKDHPSASIITKLGNAIDGYKTNNHRFL